MPWYTVGKFPYASIFSIKFFSSLNQKCMESMFLLHLVRVLIYYSRTGLEMIVNMCAFWCLKCAGIKCDRNRWTALIFLVICSVE